MQTNEFNNKYWHATSIGYILNIYILLPYKVSSKPRDWTQVSHIAGIFFTSWATREAQEYWSG